MALRGRMIAVLGLLVGLNAVFVLTVLWGFLVLVPTAVTAVFVGELSLLGHLARMPVSPRLSLGLVALFLVGQLYYGYKRLLAHSRTGGSDADHEVTEIVNRLSMTADIPTPSVRIVENGTPSCYTVGRFTDATIVVTTGLLSTLDEAELEGVLAHEIAHVANRDVTLMTVTTLVLEIATRAYHTVRLVPRAFSGLDNLSVYEQLLLRWFLPLSVVVYLLVSPLLFVFPKVAGWATRTLSYAREYAADEAGARMTGEPLALATALTTLSETTPEPKDDLRTERTQALCIVPSRLVSGRTTRSPPALDPPTDDRAERLSDWQAGRTTGTPVSGTHPPLDERISRLQRIERELEGTR